MSLKYHNPPGFVDDLTEENKKLWSKKVSSFMLTSRVQPDLEPQFYDATKVVEKEPKTAAKITWNAFPRRVKLQYPVDRKRWQVADSNRIYHDEYCEWQNIVFCNEGPEYYKFLGEKQPDILVDLYQKLNPGFGIKKADLFKQEAGKLVYNPVNKWNSSTTTGTIMHLVHPANTLGAEVDLAALATVLRKRKDGTPITDPDELIRCGHYGEPNRNSDPHIGAEVNTVACTGALVTIKNPIGLYIDSISWRQIETPDDDDPSQQWWKWTRRREGNFKVPEDKPYVLGDLLVKGIPLEFGGQLADFISISITGWATYLNGGHQIKPRLCSDPPPNHFTIQATSADLDQPSHRMVEGEEFGSD